MAYAASHCPVFSNKASADHDFGHVTLTIRNYLIAAALGRNALVRYYVETEGLHPDATWGGKPTALCYAAMKSATLLLSYLLEKGANADRADAMGMTPLHYAAIGGSDACVATLIAAGARLNTGNRKGQTPLALALNKPRPAPAAELLRRHGATPYPGTPSARQFH